ncbi:YafY family protein [Deinococcus sonorensis]|uniref:YafY family protein n=2 Tax=Deinococcus sonorensis TaxID=309891 RepID=A0AAU7UD01_9DEIO
MYDPSMRVLTVLEVLQAREQVSGPELSRTLEVSLRSVQRYVARLQDLGIPVESRRGVGGSYRLKPGYRLPPLMLTDDEALAVSLGLGALQHLGLGAVTPAAASAEAKLKRVLPRAVSERLDQTEAAVQLVPVPWTVPADPRALVLIASAASQQRVVTFRYRAHGGEQTRREVEPYGLVHLEGRWYVVGRCRVRSALRSFRLDRLQEVSVSAQAFLRPPDFDAGAYLRRSLPYAQSTHRISVWVDLPLPEAERRLAPGRADLQAQDGGTRLRCSRETLDQFAGMLLGLGCEVRVEAPDALRETLQRMAERAARAAMTPP